MANNADMNGDSKILGAKPVRRGLPKAGVVTKHQKIAMKGGHKRKPGGGRKSPLPKRSMEGKR